VSVKRIDTFGILAILDLLKRFTIAEKTKKPTQVLADFINLNNYS
jgi:hypothetical protein